MLPEIKIDHNLQKKQIYRVKHKNLTLFHHQPKPKRTKKNTYRRAGKKRLANVMKNNKKTN